MPNPQTPGANTMGMSLRELYDAHQGKLSDKWTSYLYGYDTALGPYRN
jgi:hypothetical protein